MTKDNSTLRDALVMFSGGKDSFLTALNLLHEGYRVILLTCDNGSELHIRNVEHGVIRLIKRWGARVRFAGICYTCSEIRVLGYKWTQMTVGELAAKWPHLTQAQVQCLHCQTSMWLSTIAMCRAHNVDTIGTGYKKCDVFCTGTDWYNEFLDKLCGDYAIEVKRPRWENVSDYERDVEMIYHGYHFSVFEPKCVLGVWPTNLAAEVYEDMHRYFMDVIVPLCKGQINELTQVYSYARLDDEDLNGSFPGDEYSRAIIASAGED